MEQLDITEGKEGEIERRKWHDWGRVSLGWNIIHELDLSRSILFFFCVHKKKKKDLV